MIKIHEPMLKHWVIIHIGEKGKKEYGKATGDYIEGNRDGSTYTTPVAHCFHVWIDKQDNLPTLVHELYHLTSTVREFMDIDEEASAYYIGYLIKEYLSRIQK